MTVPLLQLPRTLTVDANGEPRSGAKLYLFAAQTTNPVVAWQDPARTIPHPVPIVSNAEGTFPPIYADPNSGDLKINITDEDDIQIPGYPIDNIPAPFDFSADAVGNLLHPPTPAEIAAQVEPVNLVYPAGHVDRYLLNTGSNDMAPAFTSAGQIASRTGCKVRWGDTAPYYLNSPVNWTGIHGVIFEDESSGAASSSLFNTLFVGHNGIAFDLATSYELTFNNMVVATVAGKVPKCLFFSARNTAGSGCGIHRFNNLRTPTTLTATWIFYGYGSEENNFINCLCYNAQGASGMFSHNATNPAAFASTFVSIATGNQSGTVNRHIGCDYYNIGNSGLQNEFVFQLEDTGNFTFRDGLWACANGISYVSILGNQATLNLTFDSIRGEPIGTGPTYGVYVAPSVTGIVHSNWTFNNVTSNASNELLHFLNTNAPSMQRLTMQGCNSLISGLLLSAYNLSDSLIETLQDSVVSGQSGGMVQANIFMGGKNNINLSGLTPTIPNIYLDNNTGTISTDASNFTSASAACTGAITAAAIYKVGLIDNQVTLTLPQTIGSATAATSFVFGAAVPTTYRPATDVWASCVIQDNGTTQSQPGLITISASTGGITVFKTPTNSVNFTNGANAGLQGSQTVSWRI